MQQNMSGRRRIESIAFSWPVFIRYTKLDHTLPDELQSVISMLENRTSFLAAMPASLPDVDKDFYLSLLSAYINSANDGIFVVCDEMKFHVANRLLESWLGITEAALTAHNQRLPITHFMETEESRRVFAHEFHEALAGNPVRFECLISPKTTRPRWVDISMNRVDMDGGDLVIGIMRDTTAHKDTIAEMERQAIHDELTGLINRREFNTRLDNLLKDAHLRDTCHSLLYMDLDQFKVVNDSCGHIAGDELLRQLSALIKTKVRHSDTLARLGGDEFGVLLQDCSVEKAMEVAATLRRTVSDFRFQWQGKRFEIGVSIGVNPIRSDGGSTVEVLSAADAACYVAKDKGRNRVQLYVGGEECSHKRDEMNWVSRITQAFEEQRFRLYYQNILPLKTSYACLEHREILLRMIDEEGRVVSPGEFMPAAEKYNLMPTIDRWVIGTLFAQESSHWRKLLAESRPSDTSGDMFYSINLSGASLNDDQFLDFLREQIDRYDIPPSAVCFEITETVAISNLQRISNFIEELKGLGFRFALDDFGSGMSSFAYLKSLPVDFLKIDGALVREITHNEIDLCMVEAISRIALKMGIMTIAEYVEDDAILEQLKKIGVSHAQGYAIHKPEALV
jgi:diguanylate cyclase (GGDEF)-like protein/PAS domain S-box-containing protein